MHKQICSSHRILSKYNDYLQNVRKIALARGNVAETPVNVSGRDIDELEVLIIAMVSTRQVNLS